MSYLPQYEPHQPGDPRMISFQDLKKWAKMMHLRFKGSYFCFYLLEFETPTGPWWKPDQSAWTLDVLQVSPITPFALSSMFCLKEGQTDRERIWKSVIVVRKLDSWGRPCSKHAASRDAAVPSRSCHHGSVTKGATVPLQAFLPFHSQFIFISAQQEMWLSLYLCFPAKKQEEEDSQRNNKLCYVRRTSRDVPSV